MIVTGGAGFIGSALVRHLLADTDAFVVNVDKLTYAANPLTLDVFAGNDRHRFVQADICDRDAMAKLFAEVDPDVTIHLAAESHVDRSIDGPADFVSTNVQGTYSLLEAAARQAGRRGDQPAPRFVAVSTDEVYGSLGDEGRFDEDSAYRPNSPYAATKAAADHLARAWHTTYGLETIVTNASNNYGPYQFPEKLIPRTILRGLQGKTLEVYGEGTNVRDWIHVDDHARALWIAANDGVPGHTYNIGAACEMRNIDLVRALCAALDAARPDRAPHDRLITFVSDRPGHDYRYAVDATRANEQLGWHPDIEFTQGLRRTVDWYLANQDWWEPILGSSYDGGRLGLAGN